MNESCTLLRNNKNELQDCFETTFDFLPCQILNKSYFTCSELGHILFHDLEEKKKVPMTCSTPILWEECQSRPTPTNSAALLLCILFHARTLLPRIPAPLPLFPSFTFSLPHHLNPSILSEPLSGARAVVCKAYLGCGVSLEMRLVCI